MATVKVEVLVEVTVNLTTKRVRAVDVLEVRCDDDDAAAETQPILAETRHWPRWKNCVPVNVTIGRSPARMKKERQP